MRTLLFIAGGAAVGAGIAATMTLKGDVQALMAAVCFIGGAILFGLWAVLCAQERIAGALRDSRSGD